MIVVVKLGGSLLDWPAFPGRLNECLGFWRNSRVVLVVGGGLVADSIRAYDPLHGLGEARAHSLALETLNVTSRMVSMLLLGSEVIESVEDLNGVWERGALPIFAPRYFMETVDPLHCDPLPRTWQTTTDSIAARLARTIGADRLVLLKSASPPGTISRTEAAKLGYVDAHFPRASETFANVDIINLRADPLRLERLS